MVNVNKLLLSVYLMVTFGHLSPPWSCAGGGCLYTWCNV